MYRYDNILIYGLPDWKQPVYYYRKVRKLGFIEMCVALLIILTVGHFLVVWSIYLERKFEMVGEMISRSRSCFYKHLFMIIDGYLRWLQQRYLSNVRTQNHQTSILYCYKFAFTQMCVWVMNTISTSYCSKKYLIPEEKRRRREERD